jgi:hypothetical protein
MKAEPEKKPETASLPEASLGGLVLSLSAAALAYLGEKVAPEGQNPDADLALARHTIGTLEMLKAKTEGNRTPEEDKLFDEMLYQLRMAYVQAEQKRSGRPQDAKTPEPDETEGKNEPDKTGEPAKPGPGDEKS